MSGAARKPSIFLVNQSKRCEPSAFLFSKAVAFFIINGYEMAEDIGHSDIILVNTCCVTQEKIAASGEALDFALNQGDGKRVVLFGCMAGLPLSGLKRENLICIGPKNVGDLDVHFPHRTPASSISVNQLPPAFYAPGQGLGCDDYFLMIAQGCSNRCSYCNIKRVKGAVRSEPLESIVTQLRNGLSSGVRQFTLLADDCASYGDDIGANLADLMEQLFAAGPGFGLKLGYLYPQFLLAHADRMRRLFATGRVRYVNIPIQSASPRILALMNRTYDAAAVVKVVEQLRAEAPGTAFCTHLMVNFPTESRDDFLISLSAADHFDEVLFLNYSDNEGTAAAGLFPKVDEPEARRRLDAASDYANRCKPGRSAVIKDFHCDAPYNVSRSMKG